MRCHLGPRRRWSGSICWDGQEIPLQDAGGVLTCESSLLVGGFIVIAPAVVFTRASRLWKPRRTHPCHLSGSFSSSSYCSGAAVQTPLSSSAFTLVVLSISSAPVVSVANIKLLKFLALLICT